MAVFAIVVAGSSREIPGRSLHGHVVRECGPGAVVARTPIWDVAVAGEKSYHTCALAWSRRLRDVGLGWEESVGGVRGEEAASECESPFATLLPLRHLRRPPVPRRATGSVLAHTVKQSRWRSSECPSTLVTSCGMRIQALSTSALLVLGAALGQARSPISARRPEDDPTLPQPDPHAITTDGPRVLLISPTLQNRTATFDTCDPVYLWWFYDPQYMELPDKFNLSITNVGVNQNPPPPATTTTDPGISSESNLGSLPTATNPAGPPKATFPVETPSLPPVSRRADGDVTLLIASDLPIFVKEHYFLWSAIAVPEGYYVLHGVDSDSTSNLPIVDSTPFYIGAGDTSCFDGSNGGGGGQGTPSSTSPSGNDAAQTGGPSSVTSSGNNKTGIIAGAVVGSILGLLAVVGLFFLAALHRRQKANKARGTAWGQVGSSDSQGGSRARAIGLPVGAANRLSRNAEASVKGDFGVDSMDEKYAGGVSRSGSASTGHSAFSPEPPVFRRHSQTSQAFPLGMLSTRESRRSTIQSIPTTVTPHGTPLPSPSPVPAPGAVLTRSTSNVGATGAKKTPRKPVPAYDPNEMSAETLAGGSTPPKRSSTDAGHGSSTEADSGAQGMSSSQRTTSTVLSAFPFELDGAQGQIHYLIPDPPVSPQR